METSKNKVVVGGRGGRIKLSVCVVTYNQEKYIGQCLQSIVNQVVDFAFEVIVGDDCSTDGTRKIIEEFQEKYPELIFPIFRERNIGAVENFSQVHNAASGMYVAHIDGDDYALPGKLQAQVDFLDHNHDCNIVWHRMIVRNESAQIEAEDCLNLSIVPREGFSRGDLLRFITIGMNSSKMYRASASWDQSPGFPVLDFFANVEQVGGGRACILDAPPLGVYRAGAGIASSGSYTKVIIAQSFKYFYMKYPEHKKDITFACLVLLLAAFKNGRWKEVKLFLGVLKLSAIPGAIVLLYKLRGVIKMFKLPNSIRLGG